MVMALPASSMTEVSRVFILKSIIMTTIQAIQAQANLHILALEDACKNLGIDPQEIPLLKTEEVKARAKYLLGIWGA